LQIRMGRLLEHCNRSLKPLEQERCSRNQPRVLHIRNRVF
jgi:hypothetical protein